MPAFINDSICPNLKCNIKALDRAKAPIITDVYKRQIFSMLNNYIADTGTAKHLQ